MRLTKHIPLAAWILGGMLAAIATARAADVMEFYVDPDFAGAVQNGSAAKPWAHLDLSTTAAARTEINKALATKDVAVYFSARSAERDVNQLSPYGLGVARSDKSRHRLTLDGMSRYNADHHRPRWSRYDGSSRLEIRSAYPISSCLPGTCQDHVAIRGFKAVGGVGGRGGQALAYFRNNVCRHTRGGTATGVCSLSPFTAERNVVYGTAGHGVTFGTYWGSGVSGVVIRRNLVFNNGKSGIDLSSDAGKPVTTILIEENTVYGNHGSGLSVGVNRGGSITGLQVRNNIFCRNSPGIGGYGRADCVITGNDFYGNQPDYASPFRAGDDLALAGRNLAFDPKFTNPEDPAGPDGKFFTADDGFVPRAAAAIRRPTGGRPRIGCLPLNINVQPVDFSGPGAPNYPTRAVTCQAP